MKKLLACAILLFVALSVSAQSVEPSVCGNTPCSSGLEAIYRFAHQPAKPSLASMGAGAQGGFLLPVGFAAGIIALSQYWKHLQHAALQAYNFCVMHCSKLKKKYDNAKKTYGFVKWLSSKVKAKNKISTAEKKRLLKDCIAAMDEGLRIGDMSRTTADKGKSRCKLLYG